jgi:GAG-pre-integrase domain
VHGSGGHNTVDCRQSPSAHAQENVAELYAEAALSAVYDLPFYSTSPLVLDSGATPSFLRIRTSFVKVLRPSPVVRFADRATAQTRGQGPAVIRHAKGQLQLRNAIHAPEMRNLLSVSDLAENHDVLFQKSHAYVLIKALSPLPDRVLASATQRKGLYELDVRPSALALAAGGSILSPSHALAYHWHRKMGHASPTVLSRMARSGVGSSMASSLTDVSSTFTCSACAHGKHVHRPFVKHGAPEVLSVFDVVYSDTVESPIHSAGGAKHAGTFTDAKTRYTAISGLAKEGDVAAATRQVLAQWAVQGNTTKSYQQMGCSAARTNVVLQIVMSTITVV